MADRAFLWKCIKLLLLAGLGSLALWRGVVPAFTAISDDFPEYYTAATIVVRDPQNTDRLYDGSWFPEQTRRYRVGNQVVTGEFTPYPPPTALLLVPLTGLQPLTALRVVTVLNVLWLICAPILLHRIFAWPLVESALFILVSGWGLHACLRFGHPYIAISTFCLLGYYLYLTGRKLLGGLCLGVFAPIKYYPLMVLAGFAMGRQWRVVQGAILAIAGVVFISITTLGWRVHEIFLTDVIFKHFTGHLIDGPRFIANFQSFDTLFDRFFIYDAARNPHPIFNAPLLRTVAVICTKGVLLLLATGGLFKLARAPAARAMAPNIGILGILVLLIAPGSGTYAYVLLWLPVALLVDYFLSEGARGAAYLILTINALIGFIPYGYTYPFDGRGVLTILAYPRLLLTLAMFLVAVGAVLRPRFSSERALEPENA